MHAVSLSRVQLFGTPWTVAHQAPLSMGFSRQEYWSGVPLPSPQVSLGESKYPSRGQGIANFPGKNFLHSRNIGDILPGLPMQGFKEKKWSQDGLNCEVLGSGFVSSSFLNFFLLQVPLGKPVAQW